MNQMFLVNRVIALLIWALVKLRWLWVLGLMLRLSCLCFCGDSNLDLKCLYMIFFSKFNDENLCFNCMKSSFFFVCHDLKVLEVIHNLWSIIDGIIVKNFLECILVLLREDGDDQPLILQTKLILKETLMIVHVQH